MAGDRTAARLDELQRRIIAEKLGVSPEEVTIEFVDRILEERVYPSARFNIGSQYGGYSNATLNVLTGKEFAELKKAARAYKELFTVDA